MNKVVSGEELRPYLNPDYWSGHSIGYGEPVELWPDQPPLRPGMGRSKKDLEERLARMEKAIPLESYTDGNIFNANDYNPGTVVILRDESLRGRSDQMEVDPEELKGETLPVRPFDVSPSFGRTSTSEIVTDESESITYVSAARWGIVVQNKKRPHTLHTVSTGLTDRKFDGGVFIAVPWLMAFPTHIEVGTTKHYVSERTKSERLHRINILDVVAYGDTQAQESKLKTLAAKLALGHSS